MDKSIKTIIRQPPQIEGLDGERTDVEPMTELIPKLKAMEDETGILAVSLNAGFGLADVPFVGPSVTLTYEDSAFKRAEEIARELEEEIGLVPELTKLNPIDVYQSKDKNFMYYSFVYVTDKEFIPTLNNESSGYAWVNIGNWPKPLHDGARNTLARNKGIDKLHTILNINSK